MGPGDAGRLGGKAGLQVQEEAPMMPDLRLSLEHMTVLGLTVA